MHYINFIIFLSLCITFVSTRNRSDLTNSNVNNYCFHPDCPLRNQHTMCLAVKTHSPRLLTSGMTNWMRHQILLLHNRHRDNVALGLEPGQPPAANMRKMYWDNELEMSAAAWARHCQKRHDECRNTLSYNVLQNMDIRPVVARVTISQLLADAVGSWFSGSRLLPPESVWSFKMSNCSAPGACNTHWYTAAAWASTWRIGCSIAFCTAKKRVCVTDHKQHLVENPKVKSDNVTNRVESKSQKAVPNAKDFHIKSNSEENKESPLHRGVLDEVIDGKRKTDMKVVAYTFCNYGPAGNINGFPVYETGSSCSRCPQNTMCGDRTHRGLCSILGDPDTNV